MLKIIRKLDEEIMIGDTRMKILKIRGNDVMLGFESPNNCKDVWRKEICDRKKGEGNV